MRLLSRALVVFAGALTVSSTAFAQTAPPGVVPIAIYPEKPVRLELQIPETGQPVAFCQGPCTAYLPPAKYRLYVHPGPDTRAGGRVVHVPGPSALLVKPRSEGSYTGGLAMGIAGSAMILLGGATIVTTLDRTSSEDDDRNQVLVPMAFVAILAGLVLTPIGWVRFGKSLRPAVNVEPLSAAPH